MLAIPHGPNQRWRLGFMLDALGIVYGVHARVLGAGSGHVENRGHL
jgi:hypothetical protein